MLAVTQEVWWKRANEHVFFSHNFRRTPRSGWLEAGEYLSSIQSVKIYDGDTDVTSAMLVSSQVGGTGEFLNTKVVCKVRGGTAGKTYEVRILVGTSAGDIFEDHVSLQVIST